MKPIAVRAKRLSALGTALLLFLFAAVVQAQTHPHLFRQRPLPTQAGDNAHSALVGDIDNNFLASGPDHMTIVVPGKDDLLVDREQHQQRGARSMVWRGAAQGDPSHKVTLTLHEGILLGHIQHGSDIFSLRPDANGRTIIEKINSASFAPEWGHDHATHGHEMVPPLSGSLSGQSSSSAATTPTAAAAGATTEIVLMSVYTPQARAAAGGTTQIQAQIQAAVDQANTAFINSNMIARYRLAHSAEVAFNDSGVITTDLNWVTGDAGVASLRNTHGADMVSLITANGGGYCGIGWVQRSPGPGFAGYAFQVTALGCLTNQTLAHEHGHNLGMEHDPASAGITASGASYPWSFAHYVNGQFRTIMSYDVCSLGCPRVLHFSNPDILYNGIPTGILNQRDNAQTADLTAPIVAAFRSGGATTVNHPPVFTSNPIVKPNATQGVNYSSSLVGSANDADNDPLTFTKSAGPAWLAVSSNGALSGTPGSSNVGLNNFTINVSDGRGGSASTMLQITVLAPPTPINNPPTFVSNPIVKPNATQNLAYSGSVSSSASDPNNDPLTFTKSAGPVWLTIGTNGALSGTPGTSNVGLNSFTVNVSDGRGGSASATLQITVLAPVVITPLAAPTNLTAASTVSRRIDLSWTDNSGSENGFKIERSTNGSNFSQIATVGANVTKFSDGNRRSGRRYYYRVRAYTSSANSTYSNMTNMMAK
jgi:hypothetical protein